MKHKSHSIIIVTLALLGLISARPARATYVATIQEVGSNVVATGSGSIDFTDLTFVTVASPGPGAILASLGFLILGSGSTNNYFGISGPTNFGSGGFAQADSHTGTIVTIFGNGDAQHGQLDTPFNYGSGTPLGVSTDTWNNKNFASLGVTPGTYVWTWGSGDHADSYTLQIGSAGVAETGSTIALLLAAIGNLAMLRQKLAARKLAATNTNY